VQRIVGYALIGIGAFFLVLAPVSRFIVYPGVAKAPIDVYSQGTSYGPDATVLSIANLVAGEDPEVQTDIESTRTTRGDVEASTGDLAVYDSFVNTADADGETLSASVERVGFDRFTGEADPDFESTVDTGDGPEPVAYQGQVFKMPFDAQQTEYPWWDGSIQQAAPMVFEDVEDIDGLRTYKYVQTIEPTKVDEIDVPGDVVRSDEDTETVDRIYSNVTTIWVEPNTGAVIKGQQQQDSYAEFEGRKVFTITKATVVYSDEAIQANVDEYGPLGSQLNLVKNIVPVWGAILGVVLLVVGGLLVSASGGSRRRSSASA
jgi:hypothetical protein